MRALRSFVNACMLVLNLQLAAGLVFSAYAGCESPVERPLMGVVVLTFPLWLAAIVLVLVLDLVWWRRFAPVPVLAILAALPMVWDTCPLNIGKGIASGTPTSRIFTVLTYNVMNLQDNTGRYPGDINPAVSYILRTDADIVCLQELKVVEQLPEFHVGQAQLDSLHARYPYVMLSGYAMTLLSKYPVENLHLEPARGKGTGYNDMGGYVLQVEGRRLALFSVHMQSYSLTGDDKAVYRDLTRLRPDEDLREIKNTLVSKLASAAQRRAVQAQQLSRYIEYYGGRNVIVCGDFNDVPGCYALRALADCGLREVWPEVAFGPTWTYNDNRFYFRIDHMLWRGDFKPVDIRRGSLRASDHYPLLATFVWNSDSTETNQ